MHQRNTYLERGHDKRTTCVLHRESRSTPPQPGSADPGEKAANSNPIPAAPLRRIQRPIAFFQ